MLDPASESHNVLAADLLDRRTSATNAADGEGCASFGAMPARKNKKKGVRRSLPKNSLLKRLNVLYWQRLFRYFYMRFLRMRSTPEALARGVAAGVFAGSFPLLGLQMIIGVAIAVMVRGNKAIAAASTWISNPLTYLPLFLLNFHIGRWLLRLPPTTELSIDSSNWQWNTFMSMGMQVFYSLMLGSVVVGITASVVGYFVGLTIARRVQHARHRKHN